MSTLEALLFAHILFVVTWVGTDVSLQFLALRAMRAGGQREVDFMADVEWLGTRLLIPSALLVVVFGALLVNELGYDFGATWIILGLAGFAFSFVAGAGFLGPESGRIANLAAERGPDDPAVHQRIARVLLVSRIELVILIAIILDMVVKPGV